MNQNDNSQTKFNILNEALPERKRESQYSSLRTAFADLTSYTEDEIKSLTSSGGNIQQIKLPLADVTDGKSFQKKTASIRSALSSSTAKAGFQHYVEGDDHFALIFKRTTDASDSN